MSGGVVMVTVLVLLLPVASMLLGGLVAAILGNSLWRDGDDRAMEG